MKKNKNIELASTLVSMELNRIIEMWAGQPDFLKTYCIRYESYDDDSFSIQPTHSDTFYSINIFIQIAVTCRLSFYVKTAPNLDGVNTPTLHIYDSNKNR